MMISPDMFIEQIKNATYMELIKERKRLIRTISKYEKDEISEDHSGPEWLIRPSPDVRYQMYLEYLSELCSFMCQKYNEEYVHGERKLSEDAKAQK
ncbi:hypothetical protein [Anaerovibrio sp.]|uniref:hypothetical protein n=1 Tax=Anaerovibrio sp. TaxID=1872532 RepID=UPI00388D1C7B